MGTNCAPLGADLFLLSCCCFLTIIKPLNSTTRCLDDMLSIDNPHFEIYPTELQLNNTKTFDTESK